MAVHISELGDSINRTLARLIAASEERQEQKNTEMLAKLDNIADRMQKIEEAIAAHRTDIAAEVVSQMMDIVKQVLEGFTADPDQLRRQRKKLETLLDNMGPHFEGIITTIKDTASKAIEDKNNAFLHEVSAGVLQVITAMRETATASLKKDLKTAVRGQIVIDDSSLSMFTDKITALVDAVIAKSSCDKITAEVLAVLKTNLNKDLASKVQSDLRASVKSIHELLIHDLRGALDGQVKHQLESFAKNILAKASEEAQDVTKDFFEDSINRFVTSIIRSVQEAFRFSPVGQSLPPGKPI